MSYLAHILNKNGVYTDSNMVKNITEVPRPSNAKQLQTYSDSLGYYRRFISGISTLLEPLDKSLRKNISLL